MERSRGTMVIALCYETLVFLLSAFPIVVIGDTFMAPGAWLVALASILLIGAAAMWLRMSSELRRS